jgi:death-on-curing protein
LPNEPNWLPIEAVIEHNQRELAETGENHFVRDHGLLESALARPRNAFAYGEEDIVVLAVVLMAGIAQAHAFEQGNKRTAFAVMRLFLQANGHDTAFDDTVSWGDEIISLIEHRSTEEDFVRVLRPYIVERPYAAGREGSANAVEH